MTGGLKLFKDSVLSRTLGPKTGKTKVELHKHTLHN